MAENNNTLKKQRPSLPKTPEEALNDELARTTDALRLFNENPISTIGKGVGQAVNSGANKVYNSFQDIGSAIYNSLPTIPEYKPQHGPFSYLVPPPSSQQTPAAPSAQVGIPVDKPVATLPATQVTPHAPALPAPVAPPPVVITPNNDKVSTAELNDPVILGPHDIGNKALHKTKMSLMPKTETPMNEYGRILAEKGIDSLYSHPSMSHYSVRMGEDGVPVFSDGPELRELYRKQQQLSLLQRMNEANVAEINSNATIPIAIFKAQESQKTRVPRPVKFNKDDLSSSQGLLSYILSRDDVTPNMRTHILNAYNVSQNDPNKFRSMVSELTQLEGEYTSDTPEFNKYARAIYDPTSLIPAQHTTQQPVANLPTPEELAALQTRLITLLQQQSSDQIKKDSKKTLVGPVTKRETK